MNFCYRLLGLNIDSPVVFYLTCFPPVLLRYFLEYFLVGHKIHCVETFDTNTFIPNKVDLSN